MGMVTIRWVHPALVAAEDEEDTHQEATEEVDQTCGAGVVMGEEAGPWVQGLEDVDLHLQAMVIHIPQLGGQVSMMHLADLQDLDEVRLRLHMLVVHHHRRVCLLDPEDMADSLLVLLQRLAAMLEDHRQERMSRWLVEHMDMEGKVHL